MFDLLRVIDDLEYLKSSPQLFLDPVTPETLFTYLSGLSRGIILSNSELSLSDIIEPYKIASQTRGITRPDAAPYRELRQRGLSDTEVICEMIDLQIATLQTLSKLHSRKRK